jgi:putative ABC transport system permease protein
MFFENIKLAFSAMHGSKMRTFLSLLGIVIGVGAVVAILNLGSSASRNIKESLASGGTDVITIWPAQNERNNEFFSSSFGQKLQERFPGVENVLSSMQGSASVRYQDTVATYNVLGIDSSYFPTEKLGFSFGNAFSMESALMGRQVIVLGEKVAEKLFTEGNPIGKVVFLSADQGRPLAFKVVGVLAHKDQNFSIDVNSMVYIPFLTFRQKFLKLPQVSMYTVKIAPGFDTMKESEQITQFLDSVVGTDGYGSFSPAMLVSMASSITKTLSLFLAAIAAISLLVGGIGIMNIMLVSVIERTREIGIRKAIGATPSIIRGQFLVEAVTLTLFGGILGTVFGILISYAVTAVAGWQLSFSFSSVAIALGFSMFVGVFFGWYPAMKASRLNPIDALNFE